MQHPSQQPSSPQQATATDARAPAVVVYSSSPNPAVSAVASAAADHPSAADAPADLTTAHLAALLHSAEAASASASSADPSLSSVAGPAAASSAVAVPSSDADYTSDSSASESSSESESSAASSHASCFGKKAIPKRYGPKRMPGAGMYDGGLSWWGDEGQPQGQGKLQYNNGDSYSGEWLDGQRHGEGVYDWPDGSQYEGSWEKDMRSGFGKQRSAQGVYYEGQWKTDNMNGQGTRWPGRGILPQSGQWADGQFLGQPGAAEPSKAAKAIRKLTPPGEFTLFPDGAYYVGPRNEHGPHGLPLQGQSYHPDGRFYISVAAHAKIDPGRWVNGIANGFAIVRYPNDDTYEGRLIDGQRDGLGVYRWKNGGRYEGQFTADVFSGFGMRWNSHESEECGRWADGELVEKCGVPLRFLFDLAVLSPEAKHAKLVFPGGHFYVGALNAQNQRHGAGDMYTSAGVVAESGQWLNDELVPQESKKEEK